MGGFIVPRQQICAVKPLSLRGYVVVTGWVAVSGEVQNGESRVVMRHERIRKPVVPGGLNGDVSQRQAQDRVGKGLVKTSKAVAGHTRVCPSLPPVMEWYSAE